MYVRSRRQSEGFRHRGPLAPPEVEMSASRRGGMRIGWLSDEEAQEDYGRGGVTQADQARPPGLWG